MTTLLLTAILLLTTPLKPSYTKEEIRKEYEKIVTLGNATYNGKQYLEFTVDTSVNSIVAPFFRENHKLADYLRSNYHQVAYEYHKRMNVEGTYKDLLKDSARLADITFERFLPLLSNYLNEKGSKIEAYEPWVKPAITLDRLAGNAAKFFYPDSIHANGGIQSHICVGLNGFQDLTDVRSVMMEAFCWSVIHPHVFTNESPLLSDFSKATTLASELQLSSDPQTKLKRYQGVVWAYMSQSVTVSRVR